MIAAVFGMVGLSILELVLSMFGNGTGLFGVTGIGMITAFAGLALGIFMLILDFDMVERASPPASTSASPGGRPSASPSASSGSTPTCCASWRSSSSD